MLPGERRVQRPLRTNRSKGAPAWDKLSKFCGGRFRNLRCSFRKTHEDSRTRLHSATNGSSMPIFEDEVNKAFGAIASVAPSVFG
jgi:hypothetical protein